LAQTEGKELQPQVTPEWDAKRALAALGIEMIPSTASTGMSRLRPQARIAINPVAQLPHKTLFHELGHVVIGHTLESDFADTEKTPRTCGK